MPLRPKRELIDEAFESIPAHGRHDAIRAAIMSLAARGVSPDEMREAAHAAARGVMSATRYDPSEIERLLTGEKVLAAYDASPDDFKRISATPAGNPANIKMIPLKGKKPRFGFTEWQKPGKTLKSAADLRPGEILGVVPGSIGCAVVDVDSVDGQKVKIKRRDLQPLFDALGQPALCVKSLSGLGWHLWYPCAVGPKQTTWALGRLGGETRHDDGYVAVPDGKYRDALRDAMENGLFRSAKPVNDWSAIGAARATRKKPAATGGRKKIEREDFEAALPGIGLNFARNELSKRIYVERRGKRSILQGCDEAGLKSAIETAVSGHIPADRYRQWVQTVAEAREFNPLGEWLDSLPKVDPDDDGPALDTWHEDLWGIAEDPLVRFAAAAVFVVPVILHLHPGARIRLVPLLVGPEGCGKSTFAEHVLPPELWPDCRHSSVKLDWDDDAMARALRGKSIAVFEEMRGLRRASWAALKDLTTATELRLIPKYIENEDVYLRSWAFIGCSNPGIQLPGDPVAARRFVPIDIVAKRAAEDPVTWLASHRKRLWRLALDHVRSAGLDRLDVPDELSRARTEAVLQYADPSDLETLAQELEVEYEGSVWVPAKTISEKLPEGFSMHNMGPVLRRRGWVSKQKKHRGAVTRGWNLPVPLGVPVPLGTTYPPTPARALEKVESKGGEKGGVGDQVVPSGTGTPSDCPACRRLLERNPNSKGCHEHYQRSRP